jgi:hypothetical protein
MEHARLHGGRIKIYAGSMPQSYADLSMEYEEVETGKLHEAIEQAQARGYLPENKDIRLGGQSHYAFFESQITGKPLLDDREPDPSFWRIFDAKCMKDCALAFKVF